MKVMVIFSNQSYSSNFTPFPPIGAVGERITGYDIYNECDVLFDDWPCIETPSDPSWIVHRSMIIEIPDDHCENVECELLAGKEGRNE